MRNWFYLILILISLKGVGQTTDDNFKEGKLKYDNDNFKGAIKDFRRAIKLKPTFAEAYYYRGVCKWHLHRSLRAKIDSLNRLNSIHMILNHM